MKGRYVQLIVVGLIAALGVCAFLAFNYNPFAPRFRRINDFAVPPNPVVSYTFLAKRPFDGGLVWVSVFDRTNRTVQVLFDIERRQIVGELVGGGPHYMNAEHTRVLCSTRGPAELPLSERLKAWAAKHLGRVGISRIPWLNPAAPFSRIDQENFWVVDMNRGSAKFVGSLTQHRGVGTSFVPSPDFRFAFNKPSTAVMTNLVYLLDMHARRITDIRIDGWPVGWWSDTSLMFLTSSNDICAFEVTTGRTNCVIPFTNITTFLKQRAIDHSDGGPPRPYSEWNGKEFEILITDVNGPWNQQPTFLLRYDRNTSNFELLAREFQPEWSSHFDSTLKHYVFSGKAAGNGSDGVFLRDTKTGKETTLVQPIGAKSFSIPNFYRDRVIYLRSNALWSVTFDGKTNERIFPP